MKSKACFGAETKLLVFYEYFEDSLVSIMINNINFLPGLLSIGTDLRYEF
jgi:hypothetical protein